MNLLTIVLKLSFLDIIGEPSMTQKEPNKLSVRFFFKKDAFVPACGCAAIHHELSLSACPKFSWPAFLSQQIASTLHFFEVPRQKIPAF